MTASEIPFDAYGDLVEQHLVRVFGLKVITRDVPDPMIGDLNGLEIHIDHAVTPEQRLFLLAHLFGHTVQWNTDARAFDLGQPRRPPVPEALVGALLEYEQDAARYALSLFHSLGITEIDQWASDFAACDVAYLAHFYRTGEKLDFLSLWRANTPLLRPKPIPVFTPVERGWRSDGIVI